MTFESLESNSDAELESEPFPWLIGTRNICVLWALRIIVHLDGDMDVLSDPEEFARTRKPMNRQPKNDDDKLRKARFAATLNHLEARTKPISLPTTIRANLDLLRGHFSFSETECSILALAVLLSIDENLFRVANSSQRSTNSPAALARVLGISASKVGRAIEAGSRLRRSNLILAGSGASLGMNLRLCRGGLRKLGLRRLNRVDEMFVGILVASPKASLLPDDYAHLSPDLETLCRFVKDAIAHKRMGVNILLHGVPGTGKTELVRVLAGLLAVPLYQVADADEDSDYLDPRTRLARAVTGSFLLGARKALICFDEVEAIFNDGSAFFGKPSTAESQKSFFNRLLEENQVPMFWIANSIRGMDPAFARRFELVINLETPPHAQRLNLLERECGAMISHCQLQRLARVDHITPALVTRASRVVRRAGLHKQGKAEELLETVLNGVLQAQGHAPLEASLRTGSAAEFDPTLCNASEDVARLADGLARTQSGRICLYGPPGTGKTAFGHWLAEKLGKPLTLKRVSDLQSPFLGVMERNLAKAFADTKRDGAILQIDEVDTFLQDRRQAHRSWEVSQVNEFLTQLENFDGLFIASTNLMDGLDQAALRRFDYKVRMDFLHLDQALSLLERLLHSWGIANIATGRDRLKPQKLTPGDFAVIARRHRVTPFLTAEAVVAGLCAEAAMRQPAPRPIGFI